MDAADSDQFASRPVADRRLTYGLALLLTALTLAIHLSRINTLTLRGEEPRRAQVAVEMMRTGDWIVPRQQGVPFLSRPPLQNWLIAASAGLVGHMNRLAVRLPGVLAVVGTSLLIFGYTRQFVGPLGSFTAGFGFATMGQVLELGHLAETETLFTLLVSGSLLLWHLGYVRRWSPLIVWCVPWVFVALGTLTKGPQAPVYFITGVAAYLIRTRSVRFAFCWQHAAGMLVAGLIWGAWQIPFLLQTNWSAARAIYWNDVGLRFTDLTPAAVIGNLLTFPLETLVVCLLPWSLLLLVYARKDLRSAVGPAAPMVAFLGLCLLLTFPTVWLPPGSRSRYFMPLYPCVAPLVGLAAERCLLSNDGSGLRRIWSRFALAMCGLMAVSGAGMLLLTRLPEDSPAAVSPGFAVGFAIASMATALVAAGTRSTGRLGSGCAAVTAIGVFSALLMNGAVVHWRARGSNDVAQQVDDVRRRVPADAQLVSVGPVLHSFAFHYGRPIPLRARREALTLEPGTMFCFVEAAPPEGTALQWRQVARVICTRTRSSAPDPYQTMVVGEVLPSEVDGTHTVSTQPALPRR